MSNALPFLRALRRAPLRTRRLLIRPVRRGDERHILPAVHESVEQLAFWLAWATPGYDMAECRRFVTTSMRNFAAGTDYALLMFTRKGDFVGGTGFHVNGRLAPYLEIGYWCRTSLTGLGYTTEAAKALVRLALVTGRQQRVEIRCDPRNRASQRVIEKAGLQKEGHLRKVSRDWRGRYTDLLVYAKVK